MEMRELTDALGETRVNRRDRCEKETPVRLHPACEKSSQLLSLPRRQQQKHQDQQQHSVSVTIVGYGGVQTGAVEPAAAKTAQATQRCGHYIGHGYVVTDKSDAYAQWPMDPWGGVTTVGTFCTVDRCRHRNPPFDPRSANMVLIRYTTQISYLRIPIFLGGPSPLLAFISQFQCRGGVRQGGKRGFLLHCVRVLHIPGIFSPLRYLLRGLPYCFHYNRDP